MRISTPENGSMSSIAAPIVQEWMKNGYEYLGTDESGASKYFHPATDDLILLTLSDHPMDCEDWIDDVPIQTTILSNRFGAIEPHSMDKTVDYALGYILQEQVERDLQELEDESKDENGDDDEGKE